MQQFETALEALINQVNRDGFQPETRQSYEIRVEATAAALAQSVAKTETSAGFLRQLQERADAILAERTALNTFGDDAVNDVIAGTRAARKAAGRFKFQQHEREVLERALVKLVTVLIPHAEQQCRLASATVKRHTCELVRDSVRLAVFDHLIQVEGKAWDDAHLQGAAAVDILERAAQEAEDDADRAQHCLNITLDTLRKCGLPV